MVILFQSLESIHSPLSLQARRCDDDETSESFPVEVTVEATNEHAPVFAKKFYEAEVEEGRLASNILQVRRRLGLGFAMFQATVKLTFGQ